MPDPHGADPVGTPDEVALLTEIEDLHLRARLAVEGILAGAHRTLRRGTSVEFNEHKLYAPGDDIRHIDWRAFAKTYRYHVKQFEDETNLTLELLVDHSGSMGFGGEGRPTKLQLARTLAAALAFLALRQGDAAGLIGFCDRASIEVAPRSTGSHLHELLRALAGLQPRHGTSIARGIDHLVGLRRRRCLVFVFSDFFDPSPELDAALRRLVAHRHDVTLLQILDPDELSFPYESPSIFASLEDDRRLLVHPRTLRTAFITKMQEHLARIRLLAMEARADYELIVTDTSPAQAIAELLKRRELRRDMTTSQARL